MTLAAYGTAALGRVVEQSCDLAQRLAARIEVEPALQLLAPVRLNIVCFGVKNWDDAAVEALVADIQEAGGFAPSTTRIKGRLAIRVAIVNHRTEAADIDALVGEVLRRMG